MHDHAYTRTDGAGNVLASFDFPATSADMVPSMSFEDKLALLTVEQAFYKIVAEDVSTKKRGNLRDEVAEHYIDLYEETGAKSFNVPLMGRVVGTISVREPKEPKSGPSTVAVVEDLDALLSWESDDFDRYCTRWVQLHIEEIARAYMKETGELPEGMVIRSVDPFVPAPRPTVQLRIDPEKVADALGEHKLGMMAHTMLGGA